MSTDQAVSSTKKSKRGGDESGTSGKIRVKGN
jgi:hypothetical protein